MFENKRICDLNVWTSASSLNKFALRRKISGIIYSYGKSFDPFLDKCLKIFWLADGGIMQWKYPAQSFCELWEGQIFVGKFMLYCDIVRDQIFFVYCL